MKNLKILITGADGFIGSHLTELLVKKGYDVKAFVLYNSFNSWGWLDHCPSDIYNQFEVFSGDIRDQHGVYSAMKGCDAVLHLAALISITYSYHSPETFIETNIKGTLNVVQAANSLGISKVLHTSTSEVYGTAKFVPIPEEHPLQGQSPYSASKIGADKIAESFFLSYGTPVTILRPFNTYGPRQSARAVIPTIITQIANGNHKINLGEVNTTRDFSYVEDTINGYLNALVSEKCVGQTINLGSNFEISIKDTVKIIAKVMKKDIEIVSDKKRKRPTNSEVQRLWSNNEKAKNLLNWKPNYSGKDGFEKGLQKTIDWFLQSGNLSSYKSNRYNL